MLYFRCEDMLVHVFVKKKPAGGYAKTTFPLPSIVHRVSAVKPVGRLLAHGLHLRKCRLKKRYGLSCLRPRFSGSYGVLGPPLPHRARLQSWPYWLHACVVSHPLADPHL